MDQGSRILCRLCLAGALAARWWCLAWVSAAVLRQEVLAQPQGPTLTVLQFPGFFLGPILGALLYPVLTKSSGPRLAVLPGIVCLLGAAWSRSGFAQGDPGLFLPAFGVSWLGMAAWGLENGLPLFAWRWLGRETGLRILVALPLAGLGIFLGWNQPDWHPGWLVGMSFFLPWLILLPVVMVHGEQRKPLEKLPPWPDPWESLGLKAGLAICSLALAALVATLLLRGIDSLDPVWFCSLLTGTMLGCLVNLIWCQLARQIGWAPIGLAFCGFSMFLFWICEAWCPGASFVCGFGLSLGATAGLCKCRPRAETTYSSWLLVALGPWLVVPFFLGIIGLVGLGQFYWWWLGLLLLVFAGWAGWVLRRPLIEQILEIFLIPCFRITAIGPGLEAIPEAGPVILVSNHTTYTDPFWLGKMSPRCFIPMMTSVFYDLPGIRFLMRDVVGAIRVPAAVARKTAPELDEASAILKKGGTVLIFPEGTLRRVEEPSTKLFGRGVAILVQQHPEATVVPVWIEGGWGAYFSYAGGQPGKNKSYDFNRKINIAFGEPLAFQADELADQRVLRRKLRSAVHGCRGLLGLEIPHEKAGNGVQQEGDQGLD